MSTWRPCDTVETAVAWACAIENKNGPTSLLLSRQNLNHVERSKDQIKNISRGAYVLSGSSEIPEVIIIATGSEIGIALEAAQSPDLKNHNIRVVSMPSTDLYDAQDDDYKNTVLPGECRKRIAVEAGIPDYWRKYVGLDGQILGVPGFGESAPGDDVYEHFSITTQTLINMIKAIL